MLECSQIYELPHGYVGFGIQMGPRASSLRIFEEWPVSYHGLKSSNLGSILNEGGLLLPGDTLLDGTTLNASHTRSENRQRLYTSPSIKYAEKPVYTEPIIFEGQRARIVLQCRQKPDFVVCGETIGWERDHPGISISKHFKNSELEWFTTKRAAIVPYRILVKMEKSNYRVQWPFGTYTMPTGDIVKCDAQEVWRIGDVVKATTALDFQKQGKVGANDIGRIKKLMTTDKDVLHVDFKDSAGLVEVYPSQITKVAPGEFFDFGDWVKATRALNYLENGTVKEGSFGMVISPKDPKFITPKDPKFGLLVNWAKGGGPATLSNCSVPTELMHHVQKADAEMVHTGDIVKAACDLNYGADHGVVVAGSLGTIMKIPVSSESNVTTMSIKNMKDELVRLGGSADGCVEKADVVSRLLEARAARPQWEVNWQARKNNKVPLSQAKTSVVREQFQKCKPHEFLVRGDIVRPARDLKIAFKAVGKSAEGGVGPSASMSSMSLPGEPSASITITTATLGTLEALQVFDSDD